MNHRPVLVTLTAPTCSGKSHVLNSIRDAGLPCLVSTTTRHPRWNEREGVDYYFISEESSKKMKENDEFAEYACFNYTYYGVTKQEYAHKLGMGIAFLVVEPQGLEHYVEYAKQLGALHLSVFVDTPEYVRIQRLNKRFDDEIRIASTDTHQKRIVDTHFSRLSSVVGAERSWKDVKAWDLLIDGQADPALNIAMIVASAMTKVNSDPESGPTASNAFLETIKTLRIPPKKDYKPS